LVKIKKINVDYYPSCRNKKRYKTRPADAEIS